MPAKPPMFRTSQKRTSADMAPNSTDGDPPATAVAQELRSSDPGTSDATRPVSVAAVDPSPATPPKPIAIAHASKAPIAIFVSRKTKTIYVRQDFSPLFNAPVTIEHPDQPLGTHVFTAMEYLDDHAGFRWNVVSLPGEPSKAARQPEYERKLSKYAKARRRDDGAAEARFDPPAPPPQTPQQALARIEIPQGCDRSDLAADHPGFFAYHLRSGPRRRNRRRHGFHCRDRETTTASKPTPAPAGAQDGLVAPPTRRSAFAVRGRFVGKSRSRPRTSASSRSRPCPRRSAQCADPGQAH